MLSPVLSFVSPLYKLDPHSLHPISLCLLAFPPTLPSIIPSPPYLSLILLFLCRLSSFFSSPFSPFLSFLFFFYFLFFSFSLFTLLLSSSLFPVSSPSLSSFILLFFLVFPSFLTSALSLSPFYFCFLPPFPFLPSFPCPFSFPPSLNLFVSNRPSRVFQTRSRGAGFYGCARYQPWCCRYSPCSLSNHEAAFVGCEAWQDRYCWYSPYQIGSQGRVDFRLFSKLHPRLSGSVVLAAEGSLRSPPYRVANPSVLQLRPIFQGSVLLAFFILSRNIVIARARRMYCTGVMIGGVVSGMSRCC